jgi:transposase
VREALVHTRTRYTAIIKSLVRRDDLRVRGSAAHLLREKITALDPSPQLLEELQPLFEMLVPLNAQIEAADDRISALERTEPAVAMLMTVPGIGAVPGKLSSGDKRHIGHITKAGNARVRYLLVETTVPERVSTLQLMAAVESRKFVSAASPYEHPDAPEPAGSTREREHKADQHRETRTTSLDGSWPVVSQPLAKGRRFT